MAKYEIALFNLLFGFIMLPCIVIGQTKNPVTEEDFEQQLEIAKTIHGDTDRFSFKSDGHVKIERWINQNARRLSTDQIEKLREAAGYSHPILDSQKYADQWTGGKIIDYKENYKNVFYDSYRNGLQETQAPNAPGIYFNSGHDPRRFGFDQPVEVRKGKIERAGSTLYVIQTEYAVPDNRMTVTRENPKPRLMNPGGYMNASMSLVLNQQGKPLAIATSWYAKGEDWRSENNISRDHPDYVIWTSMNGNSEFDEAIYRTLPTRRELIAISKSDPKLTVCKPLNGSVESSLCFREILRENLFDPKLVKILSNHLLSKRSFRKQPTITIFPPASDGRPGVLDSEKISTTKTSDSDAALKVVKDLVANNLDDNYGTFLFGVGYDGSHYIQSDETPDTKKVVDFLNAR